MKLIAETAWHHEGDYNFLQNLVSKIIEGAGSDYIKLHLTLDLDEYMDRAYPLYETLKNWLIKKDQWEELIKGIIDKDTAEIDRKKLGAIVFEDYFLLHRLNILMHPLIIKEIKYQLRQLQQSGARMAVLDAPLLIELGLHNSVDRVLVVLIEQSNRLVRLRSRNPQLTSQDIIQRSCHQMSQDHKQKYADFLIDNNGNLQKTRKQVKIIFKDLMENQTKIH